MCLSALPRLNSLSLFSSSVNTDDDIELDDGHQEVDDIEDVYETPDGRRSYLVLFKGEQEPEWVDEENMNCPDLLREFHDREVQPLWPVERILQVQTHSRGHCIFKVKWLGFKLGGDQMWQPEDNLPPGVVDDFFNRMNELER